MSPYPGLDRGYLGPLRGRPEGRPTSKEFLSHEVLIYSCSLQDCYIIHLYTRHWFQHINNASALVTGHVVHQGAHLVGSLTVRGTGDRTFFNNGQQYGSGIQPIRGGEFEEGKTTSNGNSTSTKEKGWVEYKELKSVLRKRLGLCRCRFSENTWWRRNIHK